MRHLVFLTLSSSLLFAIPGCAKDPLDTSGETAADGTTGGDTGGTTGAMDDGSADMDGGMTDAGTSSSSSSTDDGAAFLPDDDSSSSSGAPDPLPNGSQCGGDAECESGICNQPFPGFGICSDCRSDSECQSSGDGVNCTLNDSGWYACSAGNLGEQCESDAGCGDPLTCEEIVNFGGFFGLTACSNCADTSECDADNVCAPVVMLDGFDLGGSRDCVAPGSIPNDSICDDNAEGDVACAGLCAPVDTGFAGAIGVCGDCETDGDCAMGQTCAPGSLGQGGVVGNSCQ